MTAMIHTLHPRGSSPWRIDNAHRWHLAALSAERAALDQQQAALAAATIYDRQGHAIAADHMRSVARSQERQLARCRAILATTRKHFEAQVEASC